MGTIDKSEINARTSDLITRSGTSPSDALNRQQSNRIISVDLLRGFVMVLMALDHVRDFWNPTAHAPEDIARTSLDLFMTRWVTHLCAPVFVFLAGVAVYLYQQKGRSRAQVSKYLLIRGLWLIVLELTLVNLSWHFETPFFLLLQVLWALGISMILLSVLIFIPRRALMVAMLCVIGGHNLLDVYQPSDWGSLDWLWALGHARHWIALTDGSPGLGVYVFYPIIPWFAVMAAGYASGPLFTASPARRRLGLGFSAAVLIAVFLVLRSLNGYGDPLPWSLQPRGMLFTILSWLNTTKYPPSLMFLCMTFGQALGLLLLFDVMPVGPVRRLAVFGRVPLFFYLIHLPLIHLSANLWWWLQFRQVGWYFSDAASWPAGYQPSLLRAYLVWAMMVLLLYLICRWYARLKQSRKYRWLSYI